MAYPVYILVDTANIKTEVRGECFTSEDEFLKKTKFSDQETRKIVYRILCDDENERDTIKRSLENHEQIDLKKYVSSVCILTPGNTNLEFVRLSVGKNILWEKDFAEAMQGNPKKAAFVLQQYNHLIAWDQLCGVILANYTDPVLQNSISYWLEKRQLPLHRLALRDEGLAKVIFSTPLAKHLSVEQLVDVVNKHSLIYQEVTESGQLDAHAVLNKSFNSQLREKIQKNPILNKIYTGVKATISPIAITHVQMMHDAIKEELYSIMEEREKNTNTLSPKLREQVAYSQFKVAQLILNNPDKVIVLEGFDHKMTPENVSNDTFKKVIEHFPTGIPKDFNELSTEQKELLRVHMAPIVLLCLGQIPAVYPASTPKLAQEVHAAIKEKEKSENPIDELLIIEEKFRSEREMQAIDGCLDAANESGRTEVFLVFGGNHKFYEYKAEDNLYLMMQPQDMTPSDLEHKKSKLFIDSGTVETFVNVDQDQGDTAKTKSINDFVSKFKKQADPMQDDINPEEHCNQFKSN
ncbi:hypothetical protein Lste_1254 [Legionella steelei]|uniref:Uncharacterized protein n=1 Tax=Legionella steelei TaxID=947033 RepID=A0A0W0ZGA1_9GAMM|nr:hypothetical protein [Legionella steelei]KTD68096.1 hypothetical protein Lste_1254 [Legionella steelei]